MAYTIPLIGFAVLACLALYQHLVNRKRNARLPPLVPGYPLVGNLPQFAAAAGKNAIHLQLGEWARQYGDIFRVQLGPLTNYYVNTDAAVKEIFDRASAATAERPRWIFSNELVCNQWNLLLLHASDPRWKFQRKVIHSEFTGVPRADQGVPFLHYETLKFLNEVINDPDAGTDRQNLWSQIGRYTYSVFAMQAFGFEIQSSDDPDINYIHETGLLQILGTLPLSRVVDLLPALQRLPAFLKPWEKQGRDTFKNDIQWVTRKKQEVMRTSGIDNPYNAMLPRILADEKLLGFQSEDEAAYLSLMLIIGAADTSKMSTLSFLEAMLTFPEVQKKAQAAIDAVVGDDIPVWTDIERIPYVRCLMKETWRWRPPVALGHPHITTRDIEFNGMLLPKGSRIHLNAWAIGHDPNRHSNPDVFIPERYENDTTTSQQSANSADPRARDHFAFGAGRRICPGYHVAERSLAVAMMRILWAFDVTPKPNAKLPMNPADYAGSMPGNPGPGLPANLTARSAEKGELVRRYWAEERTRHDEMVKA